MELGGKIQQAHSVRLDRPVEVTLDALRSRWPISGWQVDAESPEPEKGSNTRDFRNFVGKPRTIQRRVDPIAIQLERNHKRGLHPALNA